MSNGDAQQRKRHETLYFTDGNIVLLAPRPDHPALLFRVHKSVLSSHSSVFSDMFDVCHSHGTGDSEADHVYDGVPLIHMPDDAHHLESVLKILYYQSTLLWTPRSPLYPILVSPILELSRKYGIDRIHKQIVGNLISDWPQTLADWDRLEKDAECFVNSPNAQDIDDCFPEPVSAIKLAHEFDIPSILPAAFYHLSRLSILDDWDKAHGDPHVRSVTKRTARWGLLSAKDFRCLLLGKAEFEKALLGCIDMGSLRHKTQSSNDYWNVGQYECRQGEGLWKEYCDKCSQSVDPLAVLKNPIGVKGNDDLDERCHVCESALRARISGVREQIWEKLGEVFHLEDE